MDVNLNNNSMFSKNQRSYVIKRDGRQEPVFFDKITARLQSLCEMAPALNLNYVDPVLVAQKVISGVFPGVKTSELDNLAAETAAFMSTVQPEYGDLAARIAISNLQKMTDSSFFTVMKKEWEHVSDKTNEPAPLLADDVFEIIRDHAEEIESHIKYERDFMFDYFGFKTLARSYLVKLDGHVAERPQHLFMRVAIGIHKHDLKAAFETYHLLSTGFFTHATPTLFNAGSKFPTLSSCFLLAMKEDSIEGIYDTLKRCAQISKGAGGIGLAVHCIRASNSYIRGTNGTSNGLVPMLKVFSDTARYVDQGIGIFILLQH